MPTFRFKVKDAQGKVISGFEDAANKEALIAGLKHNGFTPLAIQAVQEKTTTPPPRQYSSTGPAHQNAVRPQQTIARSRQRQRRGRVKDEDLLMFTREIASITRSGIPILSGLRALQNQADNALLKQAIAGMTAEIEAGAKLSEALGRYPKIFSDVYVSSVLAGETAGQISRVLESLVRLYEHAIETKATVMTATRYPLIVLGVLGIAFTIVVTLILPKFSEFYGKFNAELPLPTRIMLGMADWISTYWYFALAILAAAIFTFRWFIRTIGRYWWDGFKLWVPVFGPLYLKIDLARFVATLETLYVSGVPLPDAFIVTSRVVQNVLVRDAVLRVREAVMTGEAMAVAMEREHVFTPLVIQMVATGEQTGNLDQHLRDVAGYYDQQIKYTTKNLTTLIEPMLTVLLGAMVLFFAVAVFLPMISMINIFSR